MKLHFTKMQGAGNDFVVIDATEAAITLSEAQLRVLGDRRFGVGADQILMIEASDPNDARAVENGIDFRYRIFNGSNGDEVEQCGNGARCFARYVVDKGLSKQTRAACCHHDHHARTAFAARRPGDSQHGPAGLRSRARAL